MGAQWKAKGKELAANAKGRVFGKLSKDIMIAARSGADPAANARLRALLLEYEGYGTKVFEFISDAHTPKNVMIVGVRNPKAKRHDAEILKKIGNAKAFHGIGHHHLEGLLIQASDG